MAGGRRLKRFRPPVAGRAAETGPPGLVQARRRGAFLRALVVGLVFAVPVIALPAPEDGRSAALILALAAAAGVFIEYGGRVPSIMDFRFAPPLNRLRFALIAAVLLSVTVCLSRPDAALPFGLIASALDFPYSPARLAADSLTRASALTPDLELQRAASTALATSTICILAFGAWLLTGRWPRDPGGFNFATNFPTLDQPSNPAGGRELARRLRWLGWQVMITAAALLFALQVLGRLSAGLLEPQALQSPLVVAWCATVWSAAPGALALRGIAILRISRLARLRDPA